MSDVGTHCLKSIESFPLKHVGMPPPASLLRVVIFGCGVMGNTIPASQIIHCVVHESASFFSLCSGEQLGLQSQPGVWFPDVFIFSFFPCRAEQL